MKYDFYCRSPLTLTFYTSYTPVKLCLPNLEKAEKFGFAKSGSEIVVQ